jgi:hypothetical protein
MNDHLTWLGITREDLIIGIMERQGASRNQALGRAEKIAVLSAELRDSFAAYWATGELKCNVTREGYSLDDLLTGKKGAPKMTPIGAYLLMDWIIKEPTDAVSSLRQGYDKVTSALPEQS